MPASHLPALDTELPPTSLRRESRLRPAPILSLSILLALLTACGGILDGGSDGSEDSSGISSGDLDSEAPRVVADGLDVPWEIRFLPGGELLVTERPGRLLRLSAEGELLQEDRVEGVDAVSESGLMGLALDPGFAENRRIYLCFTARDQQGLYNNVVRYSYGEDGLSDATPVIPRMNGARFHDGCRLEFGPEGHLFVTMGDAGAEEDARDPESLNGKILRVTTDGDPAPNNPFGNAIHSLGHRNPQGLAFDDAGRLWSTEHGPSGFESGFDELNLVIRGNDYGWPRIRGDETETGMVGPAAHSGSTTTWAPSGLAWLEGSLFFGGLRGEALYQVVVPADALSPTAAAPLDLEVVRHFQGEFGRIRAVRAGPDGFLYFGTSNRDGRGDVGDGDDRILVVDPASFE